MRRLEMRGKERFSLVLALSLVTAACTPPGGPDRTVTDDGARFEQLMSIAEQTEARGDLQTSAGLYLRAHDLLPERIEPLLKLGALYGGIGASEKAAEAYRRILKVAPDNSDVLRAYGLSLLAEGQSEAALEQFHRALQLAEDPRLYNALGVTYDSLGARETAQAYYLVGLELTPRHLSLNANLALSLALSGQDAAAIEILDSVAGAAAASPAHRRMVAIAYGLAGDEIKALRVAAPDLDREELRRSLAKYREFGKLNAAVKATP